MRKLGVLTATVIALALYQGSSGAAVGKRLRLRELMAPAQFAQAGLNKLTAAEMLALEEWLGTYTETVAQLVRSNSSLAPPPAQEPSARTASPQVIETCIEGDFEGWDGETIFKLCNGQIWQQSEYAYTYHYAYRPSVTIYRTASGYRMKVEDVAETIVVQRIK
jgi:hypothetical protein